MNKTIRNIIIRNSYPRLMFEELKSFQLMFAYGAAEQFREMINDIEEEFNIQLPAYNEVDDIGEKAVDQFITMIMSCINS